MSYQNFLIHPQTKLGTVHLTVSDLERSLHFYSEILGFNVGHREDGAAWLAADRQVPLLELVEQPGARPKPPRTTGLYHFAILVPGRADLARVLNRLVEVQYPLQGAADHLVSEALYLADPDGNGIEIYTDRPREAWPWRDGQLQMATDPLDLAGLLAELGGDPHARGAPPPQTRIGHIHLHVADLRQAEDFYCGVLGFDLVQRYPPSQSGDGGRSSALFVSAGGYHHHIGLNIWAGVGAPPPPPDVVGLRSYTLCLPDDEELDRTLDHLKSSGVEVEQEAGDFFLMDPSSNRIRLATSTPQA